MRQAAVGISIDGFAAMMTAVQGFKDESSIEVKVHRNEVLHQIDISIEDCGGPCSNP